MWNGRIYVTDIRGKGVTVLDVRQQQTRVMGAMGTGAVSKAVDIAISPDGMKYVVDPVQNAIVVFTPDERFDRLIAPANVRPVGVCVSKDLLYVTDFKNQCVFAIDRKSGEVVRKIGDSGSEDGHFLQPIGICADKDGNIYVSDWLRCRIQKFAPDGTLLSAFGQVGRQPGTFYRPKHLDVGSDGILYVADAAFNNVQLFDEESKVMMYFGSPGPHPGSMDLPAGLCVHEGDLDLFQQYIHPAFQAERLIVVTNQFGANKVSVYAMGQLKPGKTVKDVANRADVESAKGNPMEPATQPTTAPAGSERP
jgi:DNA-binding beta-propeller fold protein YncE